MKDVSMFKLGFLFTLGAIAASVVVWLGILLLILMFYNQ